MENSISSDLIRGHIDTIILYSLLDSDKFAQQISDSIIEKSQNNYEINQATLYSSLKRLEKLAYVKAYWNDAPTGRRRFFKLTEKGKKFIDDNLSNWNFSRSIIDKLLNITPEVVIKNIPVEVVVPSVETVEKQANSLDIVEPSPVIENIENKEIIEEKSTEVIETFVNNNDKINNINFEKESVIETKVESSVKEKPNIEKDFNFRNILNGLVSLTKVVDESKKQQETLSNQAIDKKDLSTAILENQVKVDTPKNNFDFSALEIMAEKEGFKIRFSNKNNANKSGKILVNKLFFFSGLITSIIMLLELCVFSFVLNYFGSLTLTFYICSLIVICSPCIFFLVKFLLNKEKRVKSISTSEMITMLIVIFDFMLILFVFEWLLGLDFSNNYNFIAYFIIPSVVIFDMFLFSVVKFFLSKSKFFKTNKNI